jgi:hypothetical protein
MVRYRIDRPLESRAGRRWEVGGCGQPAVDELGRSWLNLTVLVGAERERPGSQPGGAGKR